MAHIFGGWHGKIIWVAWQNIFLGGMGKHFKSGVAKFERTSMAKYFCKNFLGGPKILPSH